MDPRDRLIVALDVRSLISATRLLTALNSAINCVKLGYQAIYSIGAPQAVELVHDFGKRVFIDGKFFDTKDTTGNASGIVADQHVWMFNVHACEGPQPLKAAVQHKGSSLVFAVTVLSSLPYNKQTKSLLLERAYYALEAGCDGIILPAYTLPYLEGKRDFDSMSKLAVGIRTDESQRDDHEQSMTPGEAIRRGADYIVCGRPITQAPDPLDAAEQVLEELRRAS